MTWKSFLKICHSESSLNCRSSSHVVSVNFIREWRHLQLNIDFERQIFEKLFHGRFICSQTFCQKSAERKSWKKYFTNFSFDDWPGIQTQALASNKPIHYILGHGNFQRLVFKYLEHTHCFKTPCLIQLSVLIKINYFGVTLCMNKFGLLDKNQTHMYVHTFVCLYLESNIIFYFFFLIINYVTLRYKHLFQSKDNNSFWFSKYLHNGTWELC